MKNSRMFLSVALVASILSACSKKEAPPADSASGAQANSGGAEKPPANPSETPAIPAGGGGEKLPDFSKVPPSVGKLVQNGIVLTAQWTIKDGKVAIELTWTPTTLTPFKSYMIEADKAAIDSTTLLVKDLPPETHSYTFFPDKPNRSYHFGVLPVDDRNNQRVGGHVLLLTPGRTLPPATISDFKPDQAKGTVNWGWQYDPTPDLKGFRLYMDGKLVANEDKLGKNAHDWTSEPLEPIASHTFELEAVGNSGEVSERGVKRYYTFKPGQ